MKKRKFLLAAIALLLVFGIGSTIAYLTDTDTATNTFTLGGVDIQLLEPSWDADDAKNLMPNQTVAKDPTIKNLKTDTPAYVFMKVEIPCTTDTNPVEIFTYTLNSGWTLMTNGTCDATTHKATKVYNYGTSSAMTSLAGGASTPALFSNVTVANLNNAQVSAATGNLDMVVTGYGIQTQGLGTNPTPATIYGYFNQ